MTMHRPLALAAAALLSLTAACGSSSTPTSPSTSPSASASTPAPATAGLTLEEGWVKATEGMGGGMAEMLRIQPLDRPLEFTGDPRGDFRYLQRARNVVHVVHQHADTDECQPERHRDGKVRHEALVSIAAVVALHGPQDHEAVDEGAGEGAKHQLRDVVAHEAVEEARAEVLRRNRQGHDHHRQLSLIHI